MELAFHSLICLEPLSAKEFRQQKLTLQIFGSYFYQPPCYWQFFQNLWRNQSKYFSGYEVFLCYRGCSSLFAKFILYRKRKVFYGADGTNKSLLDVINKHKKTSTFYTFAPKISRITKLSGLVEGKMSVLLNSDICIEPNVMMSNNLLAKAILTLFVFTPSGCRSWFENFPKFKQGKLIIGTFGNTYWSAQTQIEAWDWPRFQQTPSMITTLDKYLSGSLKPVKQ